MGEVTQVRVIAFFVALMSILFLAGCTVRWDRSAQETPVETPIPPPELMDLPVDAKIRCYDDPNLDRGEVVVWELPGVEPPDPNSAYMGARGERLGTLRPCAVATIASYAWSETDQEFWVYVDADGLEGWVPLNLVDLVP